MAKVFGLQVDVVTAAEVQARVPLLHTTDVLGGIHIPSDGYANAVDITQALAKGARAAGARLVENAPVTAIRTAGGRGRWRQRWNCWANRGETTAGNWT